MALSKLGILWNHQVKGSAVYSTACVHLSTQIIHITLKFISSTILLQLIHGTVPLIN